MFWRNDGKLEFLCMPEDAGVIAPPVPAKGHLPGWFKKLPAVEKSVLGANGNGQTIKRCMPFLDAMTTGWILPLAATVRIDVTNDGRDVAWGTEFDRPMVSEHQPYQIKGHPLEPRPPIKIHNYWTIKMPPGWSCLFVPPLNRPHPALEIIAGVVDTRIICNALLPMTSGPFAHPDTGTTRRLEVLFRCAPAVCCGGGPASAENHRRAGPSLPGSRRALPSQW